MSQPGWYTDPSGAPGQERYWDGESWSTVVRPSPDAERQTAGWTPTGVYDPEHAPGPVVPEKAVPAWTAPPRKRRVGWIVGVVALVLATLLGGLFLWRPWDPIRPVDITESPAPTPTTVRPTASPATASPTAPSTKVQLQCTNGGGSQSQQQDTYEAFGLKVSVPSSWGFRFDASQWSWLSASARWGTSAKNPSGVVLGGLVKADGFLDPTVSLDAYLTCLTRNGVFASGKYQVKDKGPITVDGVKGQQVTFLASAPGEAEYWNQLLVLDTGADGVLAALHGFGPNDAASIKAVQDVLATAKKA